MTKHAEGPKSQRVDHAEGQAQILILRGTFLRDTTLPTKFLIVKALAFTVDMYGCDGWTIKKAECQRIDAFELWYWRRFLRVPWMVRRSNQSILKEINLEYSLDGLMLKQKHQYFGHLMWRPYSIEKTLMLGNIEDRGEEDDRGQDGWMGSLTQWTWVWASSGRWWRAVKPGMLQSMGSQRIGCDWAIELTEEIVNSKCIVKFCLLIYNVTSVALGFFIELRNKSTHSN